MPKKTTHNINGIEYFRLSTTVGYDENGKRIRKYFYGESKKEAETLRDEYMEGLKRGLSIDYDKKTFGPLFHDWIYNVIKPSVSASSFTRYEATARLYIQKSNLKNIPITKISSLDIQGLYNRMNEVKGPNTVDRIHLLVKGFLKYCVRERIITFSPADNVKVKKPIRDTTRKEILTKEDIKKVTEAFDNDASLLIYVFALYTGMRQGEILALQHCDIDLDEKTIRINKSIKSVTLIDNNGDRRSEVITSPPKNTRKQ